MTLPFDITVIQAGLKTLDEPRRIAFGTLLLERAITSFFQFQVESGAPGGAVLRAALAQCWAAVESRGTDSEKFVSVEACETVMPDSEDYKSPYTSAAIDAVNISCCLLDYLEDRRLSSIIEAIQARWDTLYLFILNKTDIDSDQVLKHPLMQEELCFVYDDVDFLNGLVELEEPLHTVLLKRIDKYGYRNHRLKL
jgi:uncharacterized protein YjaG (DUF416 family)